MKVFPKGRLPNVSTPITPYTQQIGLNSNQREDENYPPSNNLGRPEPQHPISVKTTTRDQTERDRPNSRDFHTHAHTRPNSPSLPILDIDDDVFYDQTVVVPNPNTDRELSYLFAGRDNSKPKNQEPHAQYKSAFSPVGSHSRLHSRLAKKYDVKRWLADTHSVQQEDPGKSVTPQHVTFQRSPDPSILVVPARKISPSAAKPTTFSPSTAHTPHISEGSYVPLRGDKPKPQHDEFNNGKRELSPEPSKSNSPTHSPNAPK